MTAKPTPVPIETDRTAPASTVDESVTLKDATAFLLRQIEAATWDREAFNWWGRDSSGFVFRLQTAGQRGEQLLTRALPLSPF